MAIIRNAEQAVQWLLDRDGESTIEAEDGIPINVHHHCLGIASRAYRGCAANKDDPNQIIPECKKAGVLKHTAAPNGALHLWSDPDHGHIATQSRPGFVRCNVKRSKQHPDTSVIREVEVSYYSKLHYEGWVWPFEIPGWGPKPASWSDPGPSEPAPVSKPTVHSDVLRSGAHGEEVAVYQRHLRKFAASLGLNVNEINPSGATGNYGNETAALTRAVYKSLAARYGNSWLQGDTTTPGKALLTRLGLQAK